MQPTRLSDFIFYQRSKHPLQRSLAERHEGVLTEYSTDEVIQAGYDIARGLLNLGVKTGDRLAVVAYRNRPEWLLLDLGIQMIGAVNVPVYPTISAEDYKFIFKDSEVSLAFVGDKDLYDKVSTAAESVDSLRDIYTLDQQEGRKHWASIKKKGAAEEVDNIREGISPQSLATIIYTSGTTGPPKGVMLSHENIVSNVMSVSDLSPAQAGETALSFLPLCHVFERTASYYYQYLCVELIYTGLDNLGGPDGDFMAIRPNHFNTVPRLLEKVYEKIFQKGSELSLPLRWLFGKALRFTDSFEYDKKYTGLNGLWFKVLDGLVYKKWRDAVGGRVRSVVTGAAPCPASVLRFFSAAGIPVREGYGLTETSPGIAIGRFDVGGAKIGTVGPVLMDVKVRLDKEGGEYREGEGEILAAGPNIMMGYYERPEENEKIFVELDGQKWLRTGDIGCFVPGPNGKDFLQITDRKKELLKTSGGKYVAPSPIEVKLKEQLLVEQAMVVGDNRKFVSALILPAPELLKSWCARHNIPWTSRADAIRNPKVVEKFSQLVDEVNKDLSHTEQIKKFLLLDSHWDVHTTDGSPAELTPTLKLKRRVILEKYSDEIDGLY